MGAFTVKEEPADRGTIAEAQLTVMRITFPHLHTWLKPHFPLCQKRARWAAMDPEAVRSL